MSILKEEKIDYSMQRLCDNILGLENVRFAGLISNFGNLYVGGFKDGITPYENDEARRSMYMKFALESNFRKDFDDSFWCLQVFYHTKGKSIHSNNKHMQLPSFGFCRTRC